jgi:DsbC/DsbD-like thiol-disulfide interchange protein
MAAHCSRAVTDASARFSGGTERLPQAGALHGFTTMTRRHLLLLAAWLGCSLPATAGSVFSGKGLTVELLSEVKSVTPGQPFHAGLLIRHEPGYHTYWRNPGLAGVATQLEWSLPKGWTAGEIEWPAPDKVMMALIQTHGYERDVLLMVKITPPAQCGTAVTLKTKASWMCCAKQCNPGFCDLTLELPVAAGNGADQKQTRHPAFEKERAQLPVTVAGWNFSARRSGKKVLLTGTPVAPGVKLPEKPVFFSSDNLICSHPAQIWRTTGGGGFEAELELSGFLPKDQTRLRGLLRGASGWNAGDSRAVEISVPMKKTPLK